MGPYGSKTAIEHQTFDGSLTFWPDTRSKKDKMEIFNPPWNRHLAGFVMGPKKITFPPFKPKLWWLKVKSIKKGLNFKKSALEPLKIKIFRAKTISPTYLGINLGIYDQKVQIWRGVKKDKWA